MSEKMRFDAGKVLISDDLKRCNRTKTHQLAMAATVISIMLLTACGGGGGGNNMRSTNPTDSGPTGPTRPAQYATSQRTGQSQNIAVAIADNALTVGSWVIPLTASTSVDSLGGTGHHRTFATAGATSGPAIEVHVFDHTDGYEYLKFGSWAEGDVRPNPGFYIGDTYGAFVAPVPSSGLTRPANVPTAGSATFDGEYTGYVYKQGVGTSHVVGDMTMHAQFQDNPVTGSAGIVIAQLLGADPHRSTFATPEIRAAALRPGNDRRIYGLGYGIGYVRFIGALNGAEFEVDPNANYTVTTPLGTQTFQRGDQIFVEDGFLFGGPSNPNTGQLTGGFFGPNANEAGGTYQFSTGSTHAAGAFGSRRTD